MAAIKATHPPKIDGQLADTAWQQATEATDFIQNYPAYGQPSTVRSVVKILYDDEAIYIGAHLYDDLDLIRRQLTSRDGEQQQDADYFSVFFDTYNDHQNGFQFLVTSANVQSDARLGGDLELDFGEYGDKTWDAVWQSKTSLTADGWIAEMRIPYISLRFSKHEVQTWGLQFLRFIRRNNETAFWNPVNPNVNGFVNQFGQYEGLKNIVPPLRLSFSPYLSGGVGKLPYKQNGVTRWQQDWLRSGGMDVKFGVNESFTLDATLIPDFGQVVSDNVVNNLTPYEIQFNENRPFFTEGTELFNKGGLFYSRRIGDVPHDYYAIADIATSDSMLMIKKNPSRTQLYNAIKFSGRTKNKLGIGIFNAVTAPAHAVVYNALTGQDQHIITEPLTNYNIIVLDQAFKGRSYITFTNTNTLRNGLERDANVSALTTAVYDKSNTYSINASFRYSQVFGNTAFDRLSGPYRYISRLQTIMQDGKPYAKPYNGFRALLDLGKISGKIQFGLGTNIESDGYDPTDLGYIVAPNEISYRGWLNYNQFTATRHFISYNYRLEIEEERLYRPNTYIGTKIEASGFWVFKNFWDLNLGAGTQPFWQNDYFEMQTAGVFVKKPPYWFTFLNGSTDSRKRWFLAYRFEYADGGIFKNNSYYRIGGGINYRFSNRFSLKMELDRRQDNLQIGLARSVDDNGKPVLGFRYYRDYTTIFSGNYNFTPRMNLTLRARHYWNSVRYLSFYNVKADGHYNPLAFIPGQDQNFNIFNLDAFFTWDFRPGCRVAMGYKNSLGSDYVFDLDGAAYKRYGRNLSQMFRLPHGNELTLRVIYFLDYNQFKKNHQKP